MIRIPFGYIKIFDTSGCISEKYKVNDTDSDMVIIPVEDREISGRYKPYRSK